MSESNCKEQLTRQLMAAQSRLYAYIVAQAPQPDQAHDILQNANLVMLRKLDELADGQEFFAWAFQVCHYEVLSYRRDRARDRHQFDESFLNAVAVAAVERVTAAEDRTRALYQCLDALPDHQRRLIEQRYAADGSVADLAVRFNRPYGSIRQALHRIRVALLDCVRARLDAEGTP
jgi:RNA polymerase sigma-70 factor (ECF subfamily)